MSLAVVVAAAALGGVSSSGSGAPSTLRYIALGDSFSSGEGVPPFRPGTDVLLPVPDRCHRSFRAYPALIAGRRSSPGTWGFWACSGARLEDMTHVNHKYPGEIPQLDRIAPPGETDPNVDLVTVTIGGNDAQFASATYRCVFAHFVPALGPCQGDYRSRVQGEIRRLATSLPSFYRALRARAPSARIFVLGYPDPFPLTAPRLSACRLWLASGDLRFLSTELEALNATIRAATMSANAKITYLAPTGFTGHDACSSSPWFNGLDLIPGDTEFSFHPNLLGQRRLAKIVLAAL